MSNITGHQNPFGENITAADILDTLSFFDSWEERYKYIIDLGKEIPAMPEALKTDNNLIRGCQSKVWIQEAVENGKLYFIVDSDAFIVKGLLGVVLAAFNVKTPADILAFDIEAYFEKLGLLKHLSPTRGSGMKAMVAKIQDAARTAL